MENNSVLDILKKVGAVITDGHFVGTSGKHFATYINKDSLYPHTEETSKVCEVFAQCAKDLNIDVVVGPALGGVILSQWTAYHLTQTMGKEVLGVYAEKTEDGRQVLKRGYDKIVNGKNVLIVEDLTTTGGSVKKVVENVQECGGRIVAVSVMVNKSPKVITTEFFGVPFLPLATLEVENFDAETCELCKNNIPINTNVGHGKKFLESKGK